MSGPASGRAHDRYLDFFVGTVSSPPVPFLFFALLPGCRSFSERFASFTWSSDPYLIIVCSPKLSHRETSFRRSSERRVVIWPNLKLRRTTNPTIEALRETVAYGCSVPEQPARSTTTLLTARPWALYTVIAKPGSIGTCLLLILQYLCDALCSRVIYVVSGRIGK